MKPNLASILNSTGQFVIYLAVLPKQNKVWASVGRVLEVVRENGGYWLNVADRLCSEDQMYPSSLIDGKWRSEPGRNFKTNPSWVEVELMYIVHFFAALTKDRRVPTVDARCALKVLTHSDNSDAKIYMQYLTQTRPVKSSKRKHR